MTTAIRTFTGTCKKGHKVVVARKVGDRWEQVPCGECGALSSHPRGKPSGEGALPTGGTRGDSATTRPGLDAEVALAEALNAAGIYGWEPQYEWCEGRKYRADVAFPKQRVLVEVVGRAHLAGGERLEADCERTAIAASKGWLVVTVTKKTIASGKAVEWVARALSRREVES